MAHWTKANDFQSHYAVETFLPGAKDHALTTATNFFLQFVITKVSKHSLAVAWLSSIALGTLVAAGVNDPGYARHEKTKTCL